MTVEQLIAEYGAYVRNRADRLARNALMTGNLDADDLFSVGTVAMVDAWHKYDPTRGKFLTFAHTRIVGAMWDEIRRASFLKRPGYSRGNTAHVYSGLVRDRRNGLFANLADAALPVPGLESEDEIDNILKPIRRDRDRRIVRDVVCYGKMQKQVAKENGLTRTRVSQIVQDCLEQLSTVTPSNYLEMA